MNSSVMIYLIQKQVIRLPVVIKPKAKHNQVLGISNGRLKIAITALPVDGKANKALINFITELLFIRKQDVFIHSGLNNRLKVICLPLHSLSNLEKFLKSIIS